MPKRAPASIAVVDRRPATALAWLRAATLTLTASLSACTWYAESDATAGTSQQSGDETTSTAQSGPSDSGATTTAPDPSSEDNEDECIGVYPGRRTTTDDEPDHWLAASWSGLRSWFIEPASSPRFAGETGGSGDTGDSDTGDSGTTDNGTGDETNTGTDSSTSTSTGDTSDDTGDTSGDSDTGSGTETGTGDGSDPCESDDPPAFCVGSPAPDWQLKDYQPLSCGTGQVYGLSAFQGHVTLFALLKGW